MPYRDDQAALEARRGELRGELADATRRAEALTGAVVRRERLARELAAVEAKLERNEGRRLPLLERVTIASPCSASWEDMVGDERVRFCGSCSKNVYNLSAMPSAEAEALLAELETSICVRLYRRADGTVLTTDCSVGVRKKRLRRAIVATAGAGAMAAAASTFWVQGEPRAVMGEMSKPVGVTAPNAIPTIAATPPTPSMEPTSAGPVEMGAFAERPQPTARPTMGKPGRSPRP
jgi:hypothetical protein